MNVNQLFANSKLKKFHIGLLAMCTIVVIMEGYNLVIMGSTLSSILAEWNLSKSVYGVISSSALVGMMAGSLVLSLLADRIGRKKVTIMCLTLFSVFTGLTGLMNNPIMFAVSRFLTGVGVGGAMPNVIALLSDYSPKKSKNTLLVICASGMQVGGILAPLVSIFVIPTLGWRFCYYIGFLPLLLIPFMIAYLPDSLDTLFKAGKNEKIKALISKVDKDAKVKMELEESTIKHSRSPLKEVLRKGSLRNGMLFWVAFLMNLLIIYGLNTWLPILMSDMGYMSESGLLFLMVLNISGLIGSIAFAKIADSFDSRKILVALYIVGVASILLLSINSGSIYSYTIISLCGLSIFGAQNISVAYVAHYYPSAIRTTGLGVANTVGRVGGIMGPIIGGVILQANLPIILTCVSFAVPSALASAAYYLVKDKKQS